MKTEKISLTKLFKIGTLLFGISLLLWNCEKEEIISNPNQSNLLSKLQSEFNAESFKKAIPYEFEVLWNNENKKYHKELEKYYYEFPINFTNSFNPNNFKSKSISKYSTIYKILVIENENQEHSFYIYKTYTEDINKKPLKNKNILFVEEEVLNGFNHIVNNEGEIVYAEKIENGKKDENILFKKEFKKKKTKDNYQSRMMEDCYNVTTYHYVDNYLVWKIIGEPDQWVFAGSTLTGTSVSQVCESYWLPDLNTGGGGNSGGYYTNPGNSPAYQDCQSSSNKNYQGRYVEEGNPCKYGISVNPIECGDGYEYDATLGECVLVEDQIFNDELTGKEKCLNNHLDKKGNSFVKNILENFEGESEFDIKIVSKDKVFPNNVSTGDGVNGITKYSIGSSLINIEISTSKLSNMPALAAARTLIHEYIHADMYRKLHTKYPTQGDLDFKKTYQEFKNGNFQASPQHESMAELYVNSIKNALQDFHKNVLADDYNYLTDNGTNPLPDSFYESLAWQGLKNHNVQAYIDLPDSKKTELTNALNAHYHSTTKNCPE